MSARARLLPARDYERLKSATRQLMRAAGGPTLAAERITRGSESRLSEAGSVGFLDRWLAIDQLADLEAETGDPLLTRTLADLQGYDLVARPAHAGPASVPHHNARIVAEACDLMRSMAASIADGEVTPAERAGMEADVLALQAELAALAVALRGMT